MIAAAAASAPDSSPQNVGATSNAEAIVEVIPAADVNSNREPTRKTKVIVTAEYGWPIIEYSIVFNVRTTPGVGNEQNQDIPVLSLYPNPTSNLLTIETDNPDLYSFDITSLNGQMIQSGTYHGTSHQIDLSSFQKGVYFITIRSKDFVTTRKIIKY